MNSGNDDEGILGFLVDDIRKEIKRAQMLKCKIYLFVFVKIV